MSVARLQDDRLFHTPRFDGHIDVHAHLRLLPGGAIGKGLYFRDPIERLKQAAPNHPLLASRELANRRYVPFFDYPFSDWIRLMAAVAPVVYPRVSLGEGLRRLGNAGYSALLDNQVGKVLCGVFGRDFGQVARVGSRGWRVCMNFGKVNVEHVGANHVLYHFHDMPAFLETYQVGIVEGAMRICQVEGEIRVHMSDCANGTFDVRWWEPGQRPRSIRPPK